MASSRCPDCRRWIPPTGESCNCQTNPQASSTSCGYPAEGSVALMTASLVKPAADRVERPGDYRSRGRNIEREAERRLREEGYGGDYHGTERSLVNGGVIGGGLAMVGAVIWFFAGIIYLDMIYFYPPILFVCGLMGVMKGVMGAAK